LKVEPGFQFLERNFWLSFSSGGLAAGLPDFSCHNKPKREKYTKWPQNIPKWPYTIPTSSIARPSKIYPNYQMATKYTKWQQNIPNGHQIYQHLPLQDRPKFTQIWIFGHLATLARWLAVSRSHDPKGNRHERKKKTFERKKEMERKRNNSLSAKTFSGSSGTDVMIFKKYFRKKIVVKIGVFDLKQRAKLWKKLIITLVLEKNANFFA
jgi:hypothetical protein